VHLHLRHRGSWGPTRRAPSRQIGAAAIRRGSAERASAPGSDHTQPTHPTQQPPEAAQARPCPGAPPPTLNTASSVGSVSSMVHSQGSGSSGPSSNRRSRDVVLRGLLPALLPATLSCSRAALLLLHVREVNWACAGGGEGKGGEGGSGLRESGGGLEGSGCCPCCCASTLWALREMDGRPLLAQGGSKNLAAQENPCSRTSMIMPPQTHQTQVAHWDLDGLAQLPRHHYQVIMPQHRRPAGGHLHLRGGDCRQGGVHRSLHPPVRPLRALMAHCRLHHASHATTATATHVEF